MKKHLFLVFAFLALMLAGCKDNPPNFPLNCRHVLFNYIQESAILFWNHFAEAAQHLLRVNNCNACVMQLNWTRTTAML